MVPPLNKSFASLYPICCELHSFLVPSFLKNQPRFLPILFLVELYRLPLISDISFFLPPPEAWNIIPKNLMSLFLLNTYLIIFFKIFRKHPPLSGPPATSRNCQTNLLSFQHWIIQHSEIFNFICKKLVKQTLQNILKQNIPFALSIFFQSLSQRS